MGNILHFARPFCVEARSGLDPQFHPPEFRSPKSGLTTRRFGERHFRPGTQPGLYMPRHQSYNMSFQSVWEHAEPMPPSSKYMCWIRPPLRLFPQLPSFIPPPPSPISSAHPVNHRLDFLITTQHATLRNIHPHRRRQTPDHRFPPTFDQPHLRDGSRSDLPRTLHRYLFL